MGNVCRATAVVLFVINILLGIVILVKSGFILFLAVLVSGFVSFLSLFSLGTIIENTECINENVYEIYNLIRRIHKGETIDTSKSVPYKLSDLAADVEKNFNGEWICKKCRTANEDAALFCKDCGEYK